MKQNPTALRKAAILMASLNGEMAEDLLAQMTPEQADLGARCDRGSGAGGG